MGHCETRLHYDIALLYRIPIYKMFSHNLSTAGGGVASNDSFRFAASKLDQLLLNLEDVECAFVKFCFRGEHYILGSIYR